MTSNIAIDYLNGLEELAGLPDRLADAELYASIITRMELLSYHRLTAADEPRVHQFLADLTILPIDPEIERATIGLRRGTRLKLPDSIIAATAWVFDATLVARDRRLAGIDWPGLKIMAF